MKKKNSLVSRFLREYFDEPDHINIYAQKFFWTLSNSTVKVFVGSFLYSHGLPLSLVLLYYGLEFGFRGFFSPIGYKVIRKLGVTKAMLIASTLNVCYFFVTSLAESSLLIGFSALILHSMAGGIYYPFFDVFEALYVRKDDHRNRQYAFGMVSMAIATVIGVALAGLLIQHFSFLYLALFAGAACFVSVYPISRLRPHGIDLTPTTLAEFYGFMFKGDFRKYLLPLFGQQLAIIMQVSIPIFIFLYIGRFDTLGLVIVAATLLETIVLLLFGRFADKRGDASAVTRSFGLTSVSSFLYMTIVTSPFTAIIAETYNKLAWWTFHSSFMPAMHRRAKKKFPNILLFGAAFQTTLCYGEVICLPIYALLAHFMGIHVFTVIFSMSIVGTFLCVRFVAKQQSD